MLQLTGVSKSYKTADFYQKALNDVSISFRDNEFVAILGPSGSGKTTMLNIVGGLDHYDSGDLVIDGISTKEYKDSDWDTYRNNRVGFVFQNYNLIPHQTVLSNVELALTLSGVSRIERRQRAKDALEQVGLIDHISKRPSQLSGGQMQRVAVARALINDPEILLADEPTGALDSVTSTQIMELLTQIARNRLVIMVTHNPDLAKTYATRTINLLDGTVVDDTNPFTIAPDEALSSDKKIRRTAMSFATAISLSFNNLMTKKGRTIMTAFAGSIGIIGIAAILALANGVNNYIETVEEETLSMYPISIEGTGFDLTTMMASMMGTSSGANNSDNSTTEGADAEPTDEATISETQTLSNMFTRIESNDLVSFKKFLDNGGNGITDYTTMVSYSYGVEPLIFNPDTSDGIWQVNPNAAFDALSGGGNLTGNAASYASMMTSGGNADVFSEMMDSPEVLDSQYEVVAGRWAENWDECVLVLNYNSSVNDYTLYAMGLRDPRELDQMVDELAENENVEAPSEPMEFTHEEILGVTFKLVHVADTYTFDDGFGIWESMSEDTEFMTQLIGAGEDLHVVGIVQARPDATVATLTPGIAYTHKLQLHIIEEAGQTPMVQDQLARPEVNVLTGRTFEEEAENPEGQTIDFSSMFSFDGDALSSAFTFDPGSLSMSNSSNPGAVTQVQAPPLDMGAIFGDINNDVDSYQVAQFVSQVMLDFVASPEYAALPPSPTDEEFSDAFNQYLDANAASLAPELQEIVGTSTVPDQVQAALENYMTQTMQIYMAAMYQSMQEQMTEAMSAMMTQMASNLTGAMGSAFDFNIDEEQLTQAMMSYMSADESSYDSNLRSLGYANLENPSRIRLYPKDFESKEEIVAIIDDYNNDMEAEGMEDRVLTYTDLVGTLMSSVTEIVNMISYVLVAFVAISLIVSSIMIGIITYISVLERRKEIGILRAIGASKRDVGNVFNAETLIVGFIAGVIGVSITALLCIPANIIIYSNFAVPNVALLPWQAAIILVLVSMFLSFIAGLIPASSASRKDPVEALRSE